MPTGVIIDSIAVLAGGLIGAFSAKFVSEKIKESLTLMFGLSAIAMGINSVILVKNLPVIILSLIVGTAIGISLHLQDGVTKGLLFLQKPLKNIMKVDEANKEEYIRGLITIVVLFCASANGIYGSLDSGFSGDHTILISKAIMDFFTALIFACNYGCVISLIALPQFIIYFLIFIMAKFIFPITTPVMIADFKGVGGLLMIATGYRVMKLKDFPLVDMIPALILVMPISYFWLTYILPLF